MRRLLLLLACAALVSSAVIAQAAHLNVSAVVLQGFTVPAPDLDEVSSTGDETHQVTVEIRFFDRDNGGDELDGVSPVTLGPEPVASGDSYTISWHSSDNELLACSSDDISFPGEPPRFSGIDGPFEPSGDVTHVLCADAGPAGVNADVTFNAGGTSTTTSLRSDLEADPDQDGTCELDGTACHDDPAQSDAEDRPDSGGKEEAGPGDEEAEPEPEEGADNPSGPAAESDDEADEP